MECGIGDHYRKKQGTCFETSYCRFQEVQQDSSGIELFFNGYVGSCTWAYKKTPLLFEKRGIGQPVLIPQACECGIEFIQRRFVFEGSIFRIFISNPSFT